MSGRRSCRPDRFIPWYDNRTDLGDSGHRWRAIYASSATIITSDACCKTDIKDLDYGLDEVLQVRPTNYHWKSDPQGPAKAGLIVQEYQEVIPEVVDVGEGEDKTLGVTYTDLIPDLINKDFCSSPAHGATGFPRRVCSSLLASMMQVTSSGFRLRVRSKRCGFFWSIARSDW